MEQAVNDPDTLMLQFEVLALAARLRRYGEFDTADLLERWSHSRDLLDQLSEAPAR